MKVVICGGGTRISEESLKIPKPLFEIGNTNHLAYNENLLLLWL